MNHFYLKWAFKGIALGALFILCGCFETSDPATKSTPPSTSSQSPEASSSTQGRITAIPTKALTLEGRIDPLPLIPGGLRFQFNQGNNPNFQYHKPIGDAKFGSDGALYMSFPHKHAIVRFTPPQWDLEFFGSKQEGGRDQPISYPVKLSFWNDQIQVVNTRKGQVMVFNHQFDMETLHQIHIPDPIVGPSHEYLIRSDKMPDKFFRSNQENKIRAQYMVPASPNQSKQDRLLLFDIQPQWDIVAINRIGSDLYHLQKNGQFRRHFQIDWALLGKDAAIQVSDLQMEGDAYWVLLNFKHQDTVQTLLVALTFDGTTRFIWRIPYFVDGFHMTSQSLVLFDHQEGKAQVFRR